MIYTNQKLNHISNNMESLSFGGTTIYNTSIVIYNNDEITNEAEQPYQSWYKLFLNRFWKVAAIPFVFLFLSPYYEDYSSDYKIDGKQTTVSKIKPGSPLTGLTITQI